jgi:integrase
MEQRTALLKSCPDDLATLVKAMLLTGARPGELATLNASDFDKRPGCLTLRGKTGARTVAISTAAVFFTEIGKDKIAAAPMLVNSFGQRWNKDSWKKVFKDVNRPGFRGGRLV